MATYHISQLDNPVILLKIREGLLTKEFSEKCWAMLERSYKQRGQSNEDALENAEGESGVRNTCSENNEKGSLVS